MTLKYPKIKLLSGHYRKSVSGRTLWCGPFALAMITGLEYDEAHGRAVRIEQRRLNKEARSRGLRAGYWRKTHFKGMGEAAFARFAERMGVRVKWTRVDKKKAVTLLTFTRDHTVKGKTYVLVAGNHFVTVKDGILYHSHHDPLPVEEAPKYKRAKVTAWAEVRPRREALVA